MVLLIHISIALSSLFAASYAYFRPSKHSLNTSYGFVAATLITGTYLVVMNPAHLASACSTGLMYLGAVSVATFAARRKLTE